MSDSIGAHLTRPCRWSPPLTWGSSATAQTGRADRRRFLYAFTHGPAALRLPRHGGRVAHLAMPRRIASSSCQWYSQHWNLSVAYASSATDRLNVSVQNASQWCRLSICKCPAARSMGARGVVATRSISRPWNGIICVGSRVVCVMVGRSIGLICRSATDLCRAGRGILIAVTKLARPTPRILGAVPVSDQRVCGRAPREDPT